MTSRILPQIALVTGTLLFSLGIQTYAQTWSAPTASPPNSNAYAPLNTSPTTQIKTGGLILNTGGAINGLIVQEGRVGIGEVSPTRKLDVAGFVKGTGLCIGDVCRTTWPANMDTTLSTSVDVYSCPLLSGYESCGGGVACDGQLTQNSTCRYLVTTVYPNACRARACPLVGSLVVSTSTPPLPLLTISTPGRCLDSSGRGTQCYPGSTATANYLCQQAGRTNYVSITNAYTAGGTVGGSRWTGTRWEQLVWYTGMTMTSIQCQ